MNEQMKILIAHDGSTCADDALNDLPRAGLPREADALIVFVRERWLSPSVFEAVKGVSGPTSSAGAKPARNEEEPHAEADDEYLESLERALRQTDSFFPEWQTEILLLKGSPAREIIASAKEWQADIIVVGSHGRTDNKKFALGSVAQKIANEAAFSVRVVRGQAWKNGSPSRLLIGFDGTNGAKAAVAEVARRMWIMGSEVRLVVVRDESENDFGRMRENLAEAKKILERRELAVTELIENGDPKQIITASAEEWGADCIFLGANSEEDLAEHHLLGGVATAIVARAHCTVEIVRKKQPVTNNV